MSFFKIGERYTLSEEGWKELLKNLGPGSMIIGTPDYSRGRRFVGDPGDWEVWDTAGRKMRISLNENNVFMVGLSKMVDPDLPPPLTVQEGSNVH